MDFGRLKKKSVGDPWYCRGYLPHLNYPTIQFITFRLADSLPMGTLEKWRREIAHLPRLERKLEEYRRVEAYADRGLGQCLLRNPEAAQIVETGLRAHHGFSYDMYGWVVMPNHVHFLARMYEETDLSELIQELKGVSSRAINLAVRRRGSLWAREYFDRFMRSQGQFERTLGYIHRNPVKARLCQSPKDFPYSSASANSTQQSPVEARLDWDQIREACRLKSADHEVASV